MTREPEASYQKDVIRTADGLLDRKRAEIERLRAIAENAEALRRNLEDVSCRQQNEIERLRTALRLMDEFAWTAVTADCEEARIGLNERLAAVRAALKDTTP